MADVPAVRLDAAAREWIEQQGGSVTVRPTPRHGCCGGGASLPVAHVGTPVDRARWSRRTFGSVEVYVDPALVPAGASLDVRLEGFGRWRRLFVEQAEPSPAPGPGGLPAHDP